MSTIEKLLIRGVRAFSPEQPEAISLGVPLTLIVGHNGAGKTTIIEALKFGTAGILPPGSSGTLASSFIHDPNLSGEKETTAQIKILIRAANGAKVTGTRTMTLSVKKTAKIEKVSFDATKNNSIRIDRNMENATTNLPKGQMDAQMTSWLGVSSAVLDRVIFCHQDESLWPMLGPKEVKQYFDELFEIRKYADAITQLKVLKNVQGKKLDGYRKDEQYEQVNKDLGRKVEKECQRLSNDIAALKIKISDLEQQANDAKVKFENAFDSANRAGMIVGKLEGKRIEARTKQESIQNLERNLQELAEGDDALEDMLAQYEQRADQYKQSSHDSKKHAMSLQQQIENSRTTLSNEEREVGSGEAQQANYERQVSLRKSLVKEIAQRHDLRGFSSDVDDHQLQVFMLRMSRMAAEQNAAVESAKREIRIELQGIQRALDSVNSRRTTLTARKESCRQHVRDNDVNIDRYQREHDAVDVDEGAKYTIQANLEATRVKLQSAKNNAAESDWLGAGKRAEADLTAVHATKRALEEELKKATESVGDTAQLEFVSNDTNERRQRLQTMLGAHKRKITDVLGESWQAADVKSLFDSKVEEASTTLAQSQKQREDIGRELDQIDSQLVKCRSKTKAHEAAIKTAAAAIDAVVEAGPQGYYEEIRQLEEGRAVYKTDADSCEVMLKYINQCIKDAQEKHVCRTCTRAIVKDKDLEIMKSALNRQQERYDVKSIASDLARVEEELAMAKAVAPQMESWERLTNTELPALRTEIRSLEQQREVVLQELETQDSVVSDQASRRRDVEAVSRAVASIATLDGEITSGQKSITDLTAKLEKAGMSRSLKKINEGRDKLNDEEQVAQTLLRKIRNEKDKSDKAINSLELEVRDVQRDLAAADRQLGEKFAKAKQIEELKSAILALKATMRECEQNLEQSKTELEQAQEKLDDAELRGSQRERQLQVDASKVNDSVNQLKVASQEIQAYLDRKGPEKLEHAKAAIERIGKEIKVLSDERHDVMKEAQLIDEKLRDHNETRRNIDENLMYRKSSRDLQRVQEEIRELESHDAEADNRRYWREGELWKNKHQALIMEQTGFFSEVKTKDDVLQSRLLDYEQTYKNSAHAYRVAHVQVETTKACMDDLDRYAKALDKAIMKFHSIRMGEINRIIDELWRKTYQGTDVDTIFIRSDADEDATPNKTNKTYNYRVCMLKQATEMDMRGRCSAGQKVLACIIIRLALAETFGINCGLIALDEPTTNLDRENIRALAVALGELIKVRRAQKNFQLIIITHDEEFLKCMNPSDYVDNYYRVTRDSKQKSEIKLEQISYLMRY